MDAIEAIHKRLSVGKMTSQAVPRGIVEQLLDAAVQAPDHYKVRPWRFVVLMGDGRKQLGEIMAQVLQRRFPEIDSAAMDKERAKPMRSPVIIAVGVDPPTESKVLKIENQCAAAAACENILLAAAALGLGGHWRTGDAARDPDVKRFLGYAEDQDLIAFLYLGYPEGQQEPPQRPTADERTRWMVN